MRLRSILLPLVVAAVTLIAPSRADALGFRQTSTTLEFLTLLPGQDYFWINQTTGKAEKLTAGAQGAIVRIDDLERKGITLDISVQDFQLLSDMSYGLLAGQPPIPVSGQIVSGTGDYRLSLTGFVGISDVVDAPFTATLVSNGNDNPIQTSLFGQGDQLQAPKNGTVSFVSKWQSSDSVLLSDGTVLEIGAFYLNSFGDPSAFSFSLSSDPLLTTANLEIETNMLFVHDPNLSPTGNNLRHTLPGSLSATLISVPEPGTLFLCAAAALGLRGRRGRRHVQRTGF